jgi:hypothetical protein
MYKGPYEVIAQRHNDVSARHLSSGAVKTLHVDRLKAFFGDRDQAVSLARLDYDQHLVKCISGFIGDPLKRSTCEFEVTFLDGEVWWSRWSPDITSTQAFQLFCEATPFLRILLMDTKVANQYLAMLRKKPITAVRPRSKAFLDLRFWPSWFFSFDKILDVYHQVYMVPIVYGDFFGPGERKISVFAPFLSTKMVFDNYLVVVYGSVTTLPDSAILVDEAFITRYPALVKGGGGE